MEPQVQAWQLTEFNLTEQIKLGSKFGLVKIYRSQDNVLTLVADAKYGMRDTEKTELANFLKTSSVLGFVLDIGIKLEKVLTYGHGFYAGTPLESVQSQKPIAQKDFDEALFERIGTFIDSNFQSGDKRKETFAIKTQHLFDVYNHARLLFPRFYEESYLGLMRIIDASGNTWRANEFAAHAASLSPELNKRVYDKVSAMPVFNTKVQKAKDLFELRLRESEDKKPMESLDEPAQFVFACMYSAYQYRNKFMHVGFPFPNTVKDAWGIEEDLGTAYLSPVLGSMWSKVYRPDGAEDGDHIDIHEVVDPKDAERFKDTYFHLLPTWHFLKQIAREALLKHVSGSIA